MDRRQFLSFSALSIFLSGCLQGTVDDATENNAPASNATETATPSNTATETGTTPEAVTPECWPSMCAGSKLVEIEVAGSFSGDVVLTAPCQDKELSIQPGESAQINRETDAQTCRISVSVDGEQVFAETVESHQSVTLTVGANGDVADRWVVQ